LPVKIETGHNIDYLQINNNKTKTKPETTEQKNIDRDRYFI